MSHSWPPEAAVRYLNTWLPVVAFLLELSPTVFRASPPVSTVLIILYTSPHEALLLPVVESSIFETTCAVHLESIHTWAARLNLVIVSTAVFRASPRVSTTQCVQWDVYNVYNPKESPQVSAAASCRVVDCRDNLCTFTPQLPVWTWWLLGGASPRVSTATGFRLWGQLLCTWSLFTPELPVWTWWLTRV